MSSMHLTYRERNTPPPARKYSVKVSRANNLSPHSLATTRPLPQVTNPPPPQPFPIQSLRTVLPDSLPVPAIFANAVQTTPSHKLGETVPPFFLQSVHSETKDALDDWFENWTQASQPRTIPEGLTSTLTKGDKLSNIRIPPPTIFPLQPHTPSPPKTTSKFMRFLSQNTRKTKKLEGLVISWLHQGYEVLCLSETIRKPDLPFVWNSKNQDIKTFSSLYPDKTWGATIVLGSKVSHFAAKVEVNTGPGLICAVALHLPGIHPLLIASIYALPDDPSAREAIAKELDILLLIFPNCVWAGDLKCAVQQMDTIFGRGFVNMCSLMAT